MNALKFIFSLCLFFSSSGEAALKCSANGTSILFINGAFTSYNEQSNSANEIKTIIRANSNLIDLFDQSVGLERIQSQGILQDRFNYIFSSFGNTGEVAWVGAGAIEYGFRLSGNIKTLNSAGKIYSTFASSGAKGIIGNAKAITESGILNSFRAMTSLSGQGVKLVNGLNNDKPIMQTMTKTSTSSALASKFMLFSGTLSMTNPVGWALTAKNLVNTASILAIEGDFNKALVQDQDTVLTAYFTTLENIKHIGDTIKSKLDVNQRIIISAHGEGNQLAERAIQYVQELGTSGQKKKLNKLVSILSTSPTTSEYTNRFTYMKHDSDFREAGGSSLPSNYVIRKNDSFLSFINPKNLFLYKQRNFLEYYISSLREGSRLGGPYLPMRENYIHELSSSTESLEDGCLDFDVTLNSPATIERVVDNIIYSSKISGSVESGFHDGGIFPGEIKFTLNLNDLYQDSTRFILYDTDSGKILYDGTKLQNQGDLTDISFTKKYTDGGQKILNLLLVEVDSKMNVISNPVNKKIILSLSPRQKVTPEVAWCANWSSPENGYCFTDGQIGSGWGFGFKIEGIGYLALPNINTGDPISDSVASKYYWSYSNNYSLRSDGTIDKMYITISDQAGVLYSGWLTNPCYANMTFACGKQIISISK